MGMCLLGDATLDLGKQGLGVAEQEVSTIPLSLNVTPLARDAADIRLSLPHSEHVSLEVFDASGRLAATLHNGVLQAGAHSLRWDARNAPAGVYFARLVTRGSRIAKRIVLVK